MSNLQRVRKKLGRGGGAVASRRLAPAPVKRTTLAAENDALDEAQSA